MHNDEPYRMIAPPDAQPGRKGCPRALLPLFMAVAMIVAAWVVTSPGTQAFQNADTVIFALANPRTWTPFCWGQDRLGMLLPLLALPISNPLINLWFQEWLSLSATFFCFWGVAFCFVNARLSVIAGLAAIFILAALFPVETLYEIIIHPEYGVSLALGLTGIHGLFRRRQSRGRRDLLTRMAISLTCFTLSVWVNITMPIVILPLILATGIGIIFSTLDEGQQGRMLRRVVMRVSRTVALGSLLLVAAFLVNKGIVQALRLPSTPTAILPPSMWLAAWRSAAVLLWQKQGFIRVAVLLAFLCVASTCYRGRIQGVAIRTVLPSLLLLLIAFAYFLVVALSIHVFHSSHYRYFIPAVLLAIAGCLTHACMMLQDAKLVRNPLPISIALAASALAAIFIRYGWPSIRDSEQALDKRWGQTARAVINHECTHIMGDYWRVWPAVFWTNHLLAKANSTNQVYGITYRCGPSAEAWKDMQPEHFRIAGFQPIAKAYAFGSLPSLPELAQTAIILEADLYLYQATPAAIPLPQ